MSSKETPVVQAPTLVQYNPKVDLVEIRRHPELYPRIKTTPDEEAVNKMTTMVYAAFLYRGQDATTTTIRFIANALVAEIKADTKFGLGSLSWEEIGRTIRLAVLGGGKEMYGVSVASLYAALVEYAKTEGHDAERRASQSI
ncbi:MAG: hypothetical protein IJQ61_06145 [Bacteroidales bacterium]|nr:hypothetical protein [Bacteroidales bacterium]